MRFSRKKSSEPEAVPEPLTADSQPEEAEEKESAEESAATQDKPACPNCGWHNVRPSVKRGAFDTLLSTLSFQAFRCRSCGHRFHAFRRAGGN